MKGKLGFLLGEETLKILIAVIVLGFLVYFLVSLYYANESGEKVKQAEASLQSIVEAENSGDREVEIYNPEGWWIASWPYQGKMPDSCSSLGWENCICIFEKGVSVPSPENYRKASDEGVCVEVSRRIRVESIAGKQSPIKIVDPPMVLEINGGVLSAA